MKIISAIHTKINLKAEGLEDEYGINHNIDVKEAHRLANDYYFNWGLDITLIDEVLMHYGNTVPGRELTKKEWKEAYQDYRKYCSQFANENN